MFHALCRIHTLVCVYECLPDYDMYVQQYSNSSTIITQLIEMFSTCAQKNNYIHLNSSLDTSD